MNGLETERVLSSLKDFQRDTVDYVFARMYEDASPAVRYLIADEVGLGKTNVAAGIVARAVDRLKKADPTRRVDVIYICSNSGIARQNINRLNVTGQPSHDLPDRITLLPRDISRLQSNSVNFIAFTPGTSLNMRSSGGTASERALLRWLLPDEWTVNEKGSLSLLTGGMGRDRFKWRVDELEHYQFDEKLKSAFRARLREKPVDPAQSEGLLQQRFLQLADQLGSRERLSDEERQSRTAIVGALRSVLAGVCIDSLEPDLVILDEFQRFSDILHGTDEASLLAQQLFRYRDYRVTDGDVRVLLLSATPYRMYTTADDQGADGHYGDLIQTIGFLQNDQARTQAFERALADYGKELLRISMEDLSPLRRAKQEVEEMLRCVMVRTERLAVTADRNGMLKEVMCPDVQVMERDIDSLLALQVIARSLDLRDITEYWKSAPYLVNFMDEYEIKQAITDALKSGGLSSDVARALLSKPATMLSRGDVSAYREIDPGNARLRNLLHDMLDSQAWRLLWIPPSWPYYQPEGEFAHPSARSLTKRLIFSSWQVVPKVVSALMTYEAERRMLGIGPEGEAEGQGAEARKKRRPLLRFGVAEGRPTGMPVLGLLYPSFVLAADLDPRPVASTAVPLPTLSETLAHAQDIVRSLLPDITRYAPTTGDVDERWYWAAPILLDLTRDPANARAWLGQVNLAAQWRGTEAAAAPDDASEEDAEGDDAWAAHVRTAREVVNNPRALGRAPADLAEILALLGIAGPAVTALRALARVAGGLQRAAETWIRNQAGQVAEGFRSLFNQPEVTEMLRRVNRDEPYWERVLEYGARGGLQAVLDEYAHVLVEYLGLSGHGAKDIEYGVAVTMHDALTLRTASVLADSVELGDPGKTLRLGEKMRFRTRFAVRYGARAQEDVATIERQGDVQKAFNSPFWPFILCSTSVGQEGLDFHLYCHAVVHWNLPTNPVDLEQREGRVHRYKGHAVRKNVARDYSASVTPVSSGPESDAWHQIFGAARSARRAQASGQSDLVPFWVYTTEGGAYIERHLPMIPLSKDVDRAELLRRSLAAYRIAFGQSRQDDLVQYLQRWLTPEQIDLAVAELRIDLTPDRSPNRHKSGVVQLPGELTGDKRDRSDTAAAVSLDAIEDLLDAFAAVRPVKTTVSAEALERLISDFVALHLP